MRHLASCLIFALVGASLAGGCGDDSGAGGAPGTAGAPAAGGAGGAGGGGGQPPADGGGGMGGAPPTETFCEELPVVSFAADVQPILTSNCALSGCHRGSSPDGGLNLEEGNSFAELVGVETSQCNHTRTRITPNDPGGSYLYDKIVGADLCGTSRRMPLGNGPDLTAAQTAVIEAWICQGALDD